MELLDGVAERAVIVFGIEALLVGEREVALGELCLLEEELLDGVGPVLEGGARHADIVLIGLVVEREKVGVGELLLILGPGRDIMFEERLAEIRHHGPVEVGSRDASELVETLKLEDNSHELHGCVERSSRAHVALTGMEAFR